MPGRKRKQAQAAPTADSLPYNQQNSLGIAALDAIDGQLLDGAGAALAKGSELLASGGSALGGLARAGLRAAGSLNVDALTDAARDAVASAGGLAAPAAEAALSVAGNALSAAGDLAGPALEATGEIAGNVIGAVVEGALDAL